MRLFTRNGHDWAKRFPRIVQAALKNREQQFATDGEAVELCAFDILALGGERTIGPTWLASSKGFGT